ncbi:MAG: hydrogenase maturation nickel metallochaperone HypA [Desulfotalea sp.]
MHEMSLVQNLFVQLQDLAKENNATKVIRVAMDIGPLSGVVLDSFQFGFDVLSADTPLCKDAVLDVFIPPVTFTCTECGEKTESLESKLEACPKCDDTFLIPSGGDELVLRQVEME